MPSPGKTLTRERATIFRLARSSKGKGLKWSVSFEVVGGYETRDRRTPFNSDIEKIDADKYTTLRYANTNLYNCITFISKIRILNHRSFIPIYSLIRAHSFRSEQVKIKRNQHKFILCKVAFDNIRDSGRLKIRLRVFQNCNKFFLMIIFNDYSYLFLQDYLMMDFFLTLFSSTNLTCDFGIYSELAVINRRVFQEIFRLFEFPAENTDRSTNERTLACK